ncbi:hypothetical protein AK812_SmicGene37771 [Symbiodinium microadriaticum]|uniref:Uncharacterized protein n=1 Tax=Symbiodinium microadriaticum TaxID=2951 RepID=A0A1Q9CFG0_SYMMI|nr:hypothetical protein AK812_SmicGene37771 [Symbiodinium microadriaticum]
MPKPWGEAVDIILTAVRLFPEPLPAYAANPWGSEDACLSRIPANAFVSSGLLEHSERDAAALLALEESEGLPVPAPDDVDAREIEGTNVQAYCYVMSPGYHAEVISLPLHVPTTVDGICAEVKAALRTLEQRFAYHVIPTVPQLGVDFASFVAVPAWITAAGKQVIVFDLHDVGGPVYSSVVWARMTFGDCEIEARRHNVVNWCAYAQGCSQQITAGASFLAFPGGVIQFRPAGQPAIWRSPLPSRLDRPIDWSPDPELPDYGTEWPLFVTCHDSHFLYSARRFPEEPILSFLAQKVEREPGDFLIIAPPGNILQNIDYNGISCRDALAIYPLSPSADRDAIVVFLDTRPVGAPISHVLLPEARVDPAFLIRWLHLVPPAGHKVVFRPRAADDGRLHLAEGVVVVFGFIEARPGDTSSESSEDDSVGLDSDSEDGPGPDPNEPPRGPPPPTPISGFSGDLAHRGASNRSDRSRTPNRHSNGVGASSVAIWQEKCDQCIDKLARADWHFTTALLDHLSAAAQGQIGDVDCFKPFFGAVLPGQFADNAESPGVNTAKELREPASAGPNLQAAVAALRYAATRIGQGWRYTPAPDAVHILSDSDADNEASESGDEVTALHFAILTPGYQAIHVTIRLFLPATCREAFAQIQAQRKAEDVHDFPHLVQAHPQPCPGNGLVLAIPAWCATSQHSLFLCFDTSLVDGRLFTAASPPYVSRRHLLHLAHLPLDGEIDVHLGCDPIPLTRDGQHHVAHGDVFVFAPSGAIIPTMYSLVRELSSRRAWSGTPTIPQASDDGVYGLVHQNESILYFSQFEHPTTYRAQIAACVGIAQHSLRIFPSAPRVRNATLEGHPCRTLIAVCDIASSPAAPICGVLVDARAILQGWRSFSAVAGRVSCNMLRVALQWDAPLGWSITFRGISDDVDLLDVVSGQVLVVAVKPSAITNAGPADALGQTDEAPHAPTRQHESAQPGIGESPQTDGSQPSDTDPQAETGDAGMHNVADDSALFRTCPFLILGQGYVAERVEVRLPLDVNVMQALQSVSGCSQVALHTSRFPTATRPIICFIDARPILSTITWRVCSEGLLDTGAVAIGYAATCPTGYTFCLLNSQSEDLPLDAFVRVHDGEVFTAMFRPFQVMPDVDDHTGVHLDPPGDDDGHAETDGDSGPQQNPTHSAAFPTSSQHADTGGTEHVPGSQRSFVVFGSSVMWLAKLMTTAVLAGTWPITPDCPHTRGCELGSAVCELRSHAEYDFENWQDSQRYRNTCDRAQQQRVVEHSSSMSPENRKTFRLNAIAFLFGRRVALAFCTLLVRCAVVCSCAHYCFVRHRIGILLFVLWFLLPEAAATKVPFADASSHTDAAAWPATQHGMMRVKDLIVQAHRLQADSPEDVVAPSFGVKKIQQVDKGLKDLKSYFWWMPTVAWGRFRRLLLAHMIPSLNLLPDSIFMDFCLRRRVLSVVFAAFYHLANGSAFQQRILSVIPVWFAQIDISVARAVAALDVLTDRIRRAIKLDRTAYLQGLVQNLSLREVLQPKRLYAAVRKAFPQARSSRRSTLCPLPAIRMEDGRLASSAEERNERWRGFFADQEAGEVLTDSEYAGFFLSPDISVSGQTTAFSLAALPTLGEVESAIMALRFRKASGPDGVTAETLRTAPQATAVTLYPLFLKATLATREPVEWRGGNLIALAKRATKALECSGYRSILLASVVGKIHHKIIRGKLEPYLGRSKSGLQAGTSAGVGVDMISLAVKAFRGWASHSTGVAAVALLGEAGIGDHLEVICAALMKLFHKSDLIPGYLVLLIPLLGGLGRLILHILTSTRLHVEKASAVGMSLTFAKDKSAVLFSAPLDKNDVPEIHVNAEGDHGFLVADSVGGATHFLPIVDSYRHLGGFYGRQATQKAAVWIAERAIVGSLYHLTIVHDIKAVAVYSESAAAMLRTTIPAFVIHLRDRGLALQSFGLRGSYPGSYQVRNEYLEPKGPRYLDRLSPPAGIFICELKQTCGKMPPVLACLFITGGLLCVNILALCGMGCASQGGFDVAAAFCSVGLLPIALISHIVALVLAADVGLSPPAFQMTSVGAVCAIVSLLFVILATLLAIFALVSNLALEGLNKRAEANLEATEEWRLQKDREKAAKKPQALGWRSKKVVPEDALGLEDQKPPRASTPPSEVATSVGSSAGSPRQPLQASVLAIGDAPSQPEAIVQVEPEQRLSVAVRSVHEVAPSPATESCMRTFINSPEGAVYAQRCAQPSTVPNTAREVSEWVPKVSRSNGMSTHPDDSIFTSLLEIG